MTLDDIASLLLDDTTVNEYVRPWTAGFVAGIAFAVALLIWQARRAAAEDSRRPRA